MPSPHETAAFLRHDETNNINEISVLVDSEKVLRRPSDLNDDDMKSQLRFILEGPYYFGDVKNVQDCFNERIVDNGVVLYKKMRGSSSSIDDEHTSFYHYWLAYFGDNPTGYLLASTSSSRDDQKNGWTVLIENCDTDFIWLGQGSVPKNFVQQVKMAAYGDKYHEEEDDDDLNEG